MDDLNTQQLVLLTLLVSFVTSIATGIITVSLLEKAPDPVVQTINRVVEKTIERVVEVSDDGDAPVETIVETIIVNAEDLAIEAVSKNSGNLIRIYNKVGDLKTFVGLGILVSSTGEVVTDSRNIVSGLEYVGGFSSGEYALNIDFREVNNPFAVLSPIADGTTFSVAKFGNSENVRLAQSVILLSGRTNNIVSNGIITAIETVDVSELGDGSLFRNNVIDASVESSQVLSGSILLNLNGEIIAAKINGDPTRQTAFIPANQIKDFLNSRTLGTE